MNIDVKRINNIINKSHKKIINKNNIKFDPVTDTDIKLEKIILKRIQHYFPTHYIKSEEVGDLLSINQDYKWFVDPLDGTKNYILGFDYFSILIGLFYKDKPIFSLIYYPASNKNFFSIGNNTYKFDSNNRKITSVKFNNPIKSDYTKIVVNSKNTITKKNVIDFFDNKNFVFKITGADSYNYILLAMKKIDIVVESGLKDVDVLPLIHFLKINNIHYLNWNKNKLINKKNNSLIFFYNNKKNLKIVKSFLKTIKS